MRCMLHACCGPCSLESTRVLALAGHSFAISYDNPNIYPRDEYERRLATLRAHVAEPRGVEVYEGAYDPDTWEREVGVHGSDRESRCRACYRLRLERAAARAEELGFEALCTTLTISPYQLTATILEELEAAADRHGLEPIPMDFRPWYQSTTRKSKELGMYRQNYCGCRFSVADAARGRGEAKAERDAAKRAKHAAILLAAAEGCVNQPSRL